MLPVWLETVVPDKTTKSELFLHAGNAAHATVSQSHGRQLATPDAAGVDRQQVGTIEPAECRPVTEDDRRAGARATGDLEPRQVSGGRRVDAFLRGEVHAPCGRAEAD